MELECAVAWVQQERLSKEPLLAVSRASVAPIESAACPRAGRFSGAGSVPMTGDGAIGCKQAMDSSIELTEKQHSMGSVRHSPEEAPGRRPASEAMGVDDHEVRQFWHAALLRQPLRALACSVCVSPRC